MTLKMFLKTIGHANAARALEVSHQTVAQWAHYRTCPDPRHMKQLVDLSKGKLGFEDIILPYLQHRAK